VGLPDPPRQRLLPTGYRAQMHLIRHQTPPREPEPPTLRLGPQEIQVQVPVLTVAEHVHPSRAALNDAIRILRHHQPRHFRHGAILSAHPWACQPAYPYCVPGIPLRAASVTLRLSRRR
jgi:hypothetical protein